MSPDIEQRQQTAAVLRLLGVLWQQEVDPDLLRRLRGDLRHAFEAAGGAAPAESEDERSVLDALAADFCQLWIGPTGHLPPCQSVWLQGRFQGEAAASMRGYLEALSLETEGCPADHLGIQLQTMSVMLESVEAPAEEIQRFFASHLTWADDLLDASSRRARTDFYRSVVAMTRELLKETGC